jgi:RNA polymerase sigma-70 factor (ECF subfamily)
LAKEAGDKQLAAHAAQGDRDAFQQLLERHYDRIFRVAFRFLGHREEAEDLTQEVCVSLVDKLRSYRGDAAFTTWLYTLVVNRAKDARRRQATANRVARAFIDVEDLRRGEEAAAKRDLELLEEMFNQLPDDLRETGILVVGEGLSQAEAADVLGIKEGTVSWRMSEMKNALRTIARQEV